MEHFHGPQAQVDEGAYAIKVSMRLTVRNRILLILFVAYARTINQYHVLFPHHWSGSVLSETFNHQTMLPCIQLNALGMPHANHQYPHTIYVRYHHRYNLGQTAVPDV